jgi:hypothetical protein
MSIYYKFEKISNQFKYKKKNSCAKRYFTGSKAILISGENGFVSNR